MDDNPYESPRADCGNSPVEERLTFGGVWAGFMVDTPQPHLVTVYWSMWTGLELYYVDGILRLKARRFTNFGVRRIMVDEPPEHVLEVRVRQFYRVVVDLDGVRMIDDLFPTVRRVERFAVVVVLLLVVLLAFVFSDGMFFFHWLIWGS